MFGLMPLFWCIPLSDIMRSLHTAQGIFFSIIKSPARCCAVAYWVLPIDAHSKCWREENCWGQFSRTTNWKSTVVSFIHLIIPTRDKVETVERIVCRLIRNETSYSKVCLAKIFGSWHWHALPSRHSVVSAVRTSLSYHWDWNPFFCVAEVLSQRESTRKFCVTTDARAFGVPLIFYWSLVRHLWRISELTLTSCMV